MIGLHLPPGPLHVLCLGAHPDDVEIGCGGTLLELSSRPDTTLTALVMTATVEREAETRRALELFFPGADVQVEHLPDGLLPGRWADVKSRLEACAREVSPAMIFTPRMVDAHQDHRLLGRLAQTVWRDSLVLQYEIPKWDGDLTTPNLYVGLTEEKARRKVELLIECFKSQLGRDWWDEEFFLGLMRIRGVESRSRYAEGFSLTKAALAVGLGEAATRARLKGEA